MVQNEVDSRSLLAVILHTALFAIIMVVSMVGNSLVCLAFYKNRRLRSVTNLYVLSLALADLMVAIFVFPSVVVASGLRKWPFGDGFCQFTGFVINYWAMVSLWILALTSINRYFCVVKPQRYSYFFTQKKTIISIFYVWIAMFFFFLSFYFAAQPHYKWYPDALYCKITFEEGNTTIGAFTSFAIFTFLSMLMVLFGYFRVYQVVWKHNNVVVPFVQEANIQGAPRAREIKTSRVLFVTVFGFCVSWMPNIVVTILEFGFGLPISSGLQSVPMVFACVSAWINPIIYGVMNRAFQREFQNILFCGKGGRLRRRTRGASFFVRTYDNRRTVNENVLSVITL